MTTVRRVKVLVFDPFSKHAGIVVSVLASKFVCIALTNWVLAALASHENDFLIRASFSPAT